MNFTVAHRATSPPTIIFNMPTMINKKRPKGRFSDCILLIVQQAIYARTLSIKA